jgi:hypothetical protein
MSNTSNPTPSRDVQLLGRHRAPSDFYDEVHRQVQERVPRRKYGREYKAEDRRP